MAKTKAPEPPKSIWDQLGSGSNDQFWGIFARFLSQNQAMDDALSGTNRAGMEKRYKDWLKSHFPGRKPSDEEIMRSLPSFLADVQAKTGPQQGTKEWYDARDEWQHKFQQARSGDVVPSDDEKSQATKFGVAWPPKELSPRPSFDEQGKATEQAKPGPISPEMIAQNLYGRGRYNYEYQQGSVPIRQVHIPAMVTAQFLVSSGYAKSVDEANRILGGGKVYEFQSTGEALASIFDVNQWGDKDLRKFADLLYKKGVIKTPMAGLNMNPDDPASIPSVWAGLVKTADRLNRGGRRVTPWEILATYWETGGQGWTSQTQVHKHAAISTPEAADALVNQSLQGLLGRDATDGEKRQFIASLQAAQRGNPDVDTVTTQLGGGTNTVSTGGLDEAPWADEYLKKKYKKDIAVHQAGTTYFNYLSQALAGPSSGVVR